MAALKLRYLCLKNLADVNDAQGNANAALKYYVQVGRLATFRRVVCRVRACVQRQ